MIIVAEGIEKSFGTLKVLKGISLEFAEKQLVAIVGPSGAGKTTFLQILGTLSKPDCGKVIINGIDITKLNQVGLAKFRNRELGFVFQFHHLLPEFTAIENVCLPAFIAGTRKTDAEKRAKELLGFLGLSHRLTHKPAELSGGEQQRVAVARALINNPSVIFADEPSGNLDTANKQDLHKLFFQLRDQFGVTIVVVTHDTELADSSDVVFTMVDGTITNGTHSQL
ncbi:lipoprotein-releasing system ATP-binding protein [Williamwhitmania taraxaci]|uniref:Lipoprotein-releasing system ATP-binding protein n=1 Tax=Williamwhitmania taraxaci TaxID=1640674 RepID=A0A1G6RPM3_9BACT|nr:lipoprotein-releasing system ATP-binding protein [Williamwhitmania taraxaci]